MATTRLAEQFKNSLRKYFPRGVAWNFDKQSKIGLLVDALSIEFCRVQERLNQFLIEIDPRQTSELLTDWEASLGLPDECSDLGATVEERRNQVVQKLTNTGGSSAAYYESIAANLGFDVTVSDFQRFQAGLSQAGDPITNEDWDYYFQVATPAEVNTTFRAGISTAGDKLVTLGNKTLECTFQKLKPAHTEVLFVFV